MIEIKKIKDSERAGKVSHQLFIDGLLIDEVEIDAYDDKAEIYHISTFDREASNKIISHALAEFPSIDSLTCWYDLNWLELTAQIRIDYMPKEQLFKAVFLLSKLSRWRRQYSFRDYFLELRRLYMASGE